MSRKRIAEALTHLQGALKVLTLYPEGHPGIQAPLQDFTGDISSLLEAGRPFVLEITDDVLVFDDLPFYDTDTVWHLLVATIRARGIESISFQPGIEADEVLGILKILKGGDPADSTDLAAQWKDHEIVHASFREANPDGEIRTQAYRIYEESLHTVQKAMTELAAGRIPSTRMVTDLVVKLRTLILEDADALMGMAMLKSYEDYAYNHAVNVSIYCLRLGRELDLGPAELRAFGLGGLLHDLGKVRTNESITRKPGRLDDGELRLIKLHPELGAEILDSMQGMDPMARSLVLQHHVRFDRTGYPESLADSEIHPLADGLAIADSYDAITSTRPHQRSRHPAAAIRMIQEGSSTAYRPEFVERFIQMLGAYPIGETVRLANSEIGVVVSKNPRDATSPELRLVMGPDGSLLRECPRVDLAEPSEAKRKIVTALDPLSKGIDVAAVLELDARA